MCLLVKWETSTTVTTIFVGSPADNYDKCASSSAGSHRWLPQASSEIVPAGLKDKLIATTNRTVSVTQNLYRLSVDLTRGQGRFSTIKLYHKSYFFSTWSITVNNWLWGMFFFRHLRSSVIVQRPVACFVLCPWREGDQRKNNRVQENMISAL